MTPPAFPVYKSRFLKADRRTVSEAAGSRVHHTQFERQARFDDVFLQPGTCWPPAAPGWATELLVLPIVGGALLSTPQATDQPLLPGYIYTVPAADVAGCTLTNPFEQETVNLLLLWAPVPAAATATVQEVELPLTAKNVLVTTAGQALPTQVGLFDSRVKGTIAAGSAGRLSLCYVLNGSFEIEDRLAEHRDALVLWDTSRIEFEALSETGILFYLELAGKPPN